MSRLALVVTALFFASCTAAPPPDPNAPELTDDERSRPVAAQPSVPASSSPAGTAAGGANQAPAGVFQASDGSQVKIAERWKERGLVVVFYRGKWCKQCRRQLSEFQESITDIRGRGYEVVGVSTDAPETSAGLITKLGLDYDLLSDKGGLNINTWGVYSTVHDLARPSVFVIAPGGEILYRYVSDSPSDRPSIETLLGAMTAKPVPE